MLRSFLSHATPMMTMRQINPAALRLFSTNHDLEMIEGKVFEVLKAGAKCNVAKLARSASFEELGFDSLDEVELVVAMEEHIGLELSNSDAEKIHSVVDAIQVFYDYWNKAKELKKEE